MESDGSLLSKKGANTELEKEGREERREYSWEEFCKVQRDYGVHYLEEKQGPER
jgi:hypothetical protein